MRGRYQFTDADLIAIGGLASSDSNFIVGSATGWVAESGATARTSLGVGTGDTPTFAGLTLSDDLVFSAAAKGVHTDTEDGNDTEYIFIAGGGAGPASRGAIVSVYGNEHASTPGLLSLVGGTVAGGGIALIAGNVANNDIRFVVENSERGRFRAEGLQLADGLKLHTEESAGKTFTLSAYDTDGSSWVDFITLTANNTPTCTIDSTIIGGTTPAVGTFTTLTLTAPTAQDYKWIDDSGFLALQAQTSGQVGGFNFFSKDSDGTDNVAIRLYMAGDPGGGGAASENLIIQSFATDSNYRILSVGAGSDHPIIIGMDPDVLNYDQFTLNTDGTSDFGHKVTITGQDQATAGLSAIDALIVTGGQGGASTGASDGRTGSDIRMTGGRGGSGTGSKDGGPGGSIVLIAGQGGAQTGAPGVPGDGGDVFLTPGATGGAGGGVGSVFIGDGGVTNYVRISRGGDITLQGGAEIFLLDTKRVFFGTTDTDLRIYSNGTSGILDVATALRVGNDVTNYVNISATGDLSFVGSAGFYPRFLTQADEPAAGTGATQCDTSEMVIWKDSDDNKIYFCFNDGGTVKTVEAA